MSTANYPANLWPVNPKLGKETTAAMRKARINIRDLAAAARVSESWVKQMRGGRIDSPEAAKLRRMAAVLGTDATPFLALADRLGAATDNHDNGQSAPAGDLGALVTEMREQTKVARDQADAIQSQADAIRELTAEIRVASLAVLGGQEGTATLLADLVRLAGEGRLAELVPLLRPGSDT